MKDLIKNSNLLTNIFDYISKNLIIISIISIISLIITIICYFKIFEKANKKGYKFLIPIYNILIIFEIASLSKWNILFYIIPFIFSILVFYLAAVVSNYMLILLIIPVVSFTFITFKLHIKLAHKFNMSTVFGLFLLIPPVNLILLLILAFSKKVAYSQNKINTKTVNTKISNNVINVEIKSTNRVCPKCNKNLNDNAIYCTTCEQYIDVK